MDGSTKTCCFQDFIYYIDVYRKQFHIYIYRLFLRFLGKFDRGNHPISISVPLLAAPRFTGAAGCGSRSSWRFGPRTWQGSTWFGWGKTVIDWLFYGENGGSLLWMNYQLGKTCKSFEQWLPAGGPGWWLVRGLYIQSKLGIITINQYGVGSPQLPNMGYSSNILSRYPIDWEIYGKSHY